MDMQQVRTARRLCFFAHYDQDGIIAPHVHHYLTCLRQAGFLVVVVSTANLPSDEADRITDAGMHLILRENAGMDFGGWIDACIRFFPIEAELLLLANDSVYGPLSNIGDFIDGLVTDEADFFGAVESREITPHLQSWFLLFRPAAYRSAVFTNMMCRPMVDVADKGNLILHYEVGLSRMLQEAGLRLRAAFSPASVGSIAERYPYNSAHILWREMIEAGVPFIKVELLRYNLVRVTNTTDWSAMVKSRSPALASMIEADLARRGVKQRPSFGQMSYAAPIYWPEVRKLLVTDYRWGVKGRKIRITALRWAIATASLPRSLYTRMFPHRINRRD